MVYEGGREGTKIDHTTVVDDEAEAWVAGGGATGIGLEIGGGRVANANIANGFGCAEVGRAFVNTPAAADEALIDAEVATLG